MPKIRVEINYEGHAVHIGTVVIALTTDCKFQGHLEAKEIPDQQAEIDDLKATLKGAKDLILSMMRKEGDEEAEDGK